MGEKYGPYPSTKAKVLGKWKWKNEVCGKTTKKPELATPKLLLPYLDVKATVGISANGN